MKRPQFESLRQKLQAGSQQPAAEMKQRGSDNSESSLQQLPRQAPVAVAAQGWELYLESTYLSLDVLDFSCHNGGSIKT